MILKYTRSNALRSVLHEYMPFGKLCYCYSSKNLINDIKMGETPRSGPERENDILEFVF
jgi:hypothetical protein